MSVRNALLGLLEQRPRHGYELRAAFEAMMGGERNWEVKPAQIYTTLARLEESGLVAQESVEKDGGPEKRVYCLTPTGRLELAGWLLEPVKAERQRDEFFLKLMLAIATGGADPRRILYTQRAALFQELHDLTQQRNARNPRRELAYVLLLDQAIMHVEADLRWLDMIESRLDEIPPPPRPPPAARPRGRPPKR